MITLQEYLISYNKHPEYTDKYDGREHDINNIVEYNKYLCDKYQWLKPRNRWSGELVTDYNYQYTELDEMPEGWRLAFGEQMCEEIQQQLLEDNYVDQFRILEIKEKYGGLRFYINSASEKIHKIIDKYENMSYNICIRCGKKAKWTTCGWISPFCDDCKTYLEDSIHDKFELLNTEEEVKND